MGEEGKINSMPGDVSGKMTHGTDTSSSELL